MIGHRFILDFVSRMTIFGLRGGVSLKGAIRKTKSSRKLIAISLPLFLLFTIGIIFPYYIKLDNVEAAPEPSTEGTHSGISKFSNLTFSITNPEVSVNLAGLSSTGTFVSSDTNSSASFAVTTDNYTGYTVSISSSSASLTNTEDETKTIPSISSTVMSGANVRHLDVRTTIIHPGGYDTRAYGRSMRCILN